MVLYALGLVQFSSPCGVAETRSTKPELWEHFIWLCLDKKRQTLNSLHSRQPQREVGKRSSITFFCHFFGAFWPHSFCGRVKIRVVADVWKKDVWSSRPGLGVQVLAVFSFISQGKSQFKKCLGNRLEVPDILLPDIRGLLTNALESGPCDSLTVLLRDQPQSDEF